MHRHRVSKCCWKSVTDRSTQCSVATDLQYVTNGISVKLSKPRQWCHLRGCWFSHRGWQPEVVHSGRPPWREIQVVLERGLDLMYRAESWVKKGLQAFRRCCPRWPSAGRRTSKGVTGDRQRVKMSDRLRGRRCRKRGNTESSPISVLITSFTSSSVQTFTGNKYQS